MRPHGRGRRRRWFGLLACLTLTAALAAGGSALGWSGTGTISTVAGDGTGGFGGDGVHATLTSLKYPEGVAATADGGFLIADKENNRIRRVAPDGDISTVAGTGAEGYNGDGIAAAGAKLKKPEGVAALLGGGFLIADTGNHRIRRVTPLGTIETVAGTGNSSYSGDGGDATLAELQSPRAAVPTPDGGFLIADTGNHVVRRVAPDGTISTVAGTGAPGSGGDGGPATSATLDEPDDIAPTPDGGFLIADYTAHVVREVSQQGTISTVVGDASQPASTGDGGLASDARLDTPTDVEPLPDGGFLIADHDRDRLRHVRADGVIVNFAGTEQNGFSGDGGPATDADLHGPHAISLTEGGDVLIADSDNHRIRSVDADFAAPSDEPAQDQRPVHPDHPDHPDHPLGGPPGQTHEPVLGVSVVVAPSFGQVMVKLPGGDHWLALEEGASLPVGTMVKAIKGTVVLTSALSDGESQTGTFWGGIFQIGQARSGNGMTEIKLRGGSFRRCRSKARPAGPSAVASRRRRAIRRLWAKDDHGRFRTHGRDSVATTRGTVWSTEDRCSGTLTRVREGSVRVRHRHSRKSVLVKAGQKYLARSRR